jgi:hypothetical protein
MWTTQNALRQEAVAPEERPPLSTDAAEPRAETVANHEGRIDTSLVFGCQRFAAHFLTQLRPELRSDPESRT